MKKIIILITLSFFMFSCGSTKTVRTSKKVIKGEWTLQNITYNQTGTFNVSLFNEGPKACFENSQWKFVSNNSTGMYEITKSDCKLGIRNFNFSIQEIDETTGLYDFLLKPTDNKGNSETNNGFRINLTQLSDTNMTWQQRLTLDGKPFILNMNFVKIN